MNKKLLIALFFVFSVISVYAQSVFQGTWIGEYSNPQGMSMTMAWTFNEADSTYVTDMNNDGAIEVKGKFKVVEDIIELSDISGTMACAKFEKGIYKFKVEGNNLDLILVEDTCPGRSMITPEATWTKKE